MKRPLSLIGLTLFGSLLALSAIGGVFHLIFTIFAGIFSFLSLIFIKRLGHVYSSAAFTMLFAAVLWGVFTVFLYQPAVSLDGRTGVVSGRIVSVITGNSGGSSFVIKTDLVDIDGAPQSIKMRIHTSDDLGCDSYNRITLPVSFFSIKDEYGILSDESDKANGIFIRGYAVSPEEIVIEDDGYRPPFYYILKARVWTGEMFCSTLPGDTGVMCMALLTGDRTGLSSSFSDALNSTGTTHVISVSGLHVAIISGAMLFILKRLRFKKSVNILITLVFLFFFIVFTGLSAPAVRSGIMCAIMLCGNLFGRKADSLNSLGIALIIILVLNPFAAAGLSLMYSAFSVLGMLTMSGRIRNLLYRIFRVKRKKGLFKSASDTLAVSIAATVGALPVSVMVFGSFSIIGPIVNILIVPLTSFALPVLMVSCAVSAGFGGFLLPVIRLSSLPVEATILIINIFEKIPFASLTLPENSGNLWLAACLVLACVVVLYKGRGLKVSVILCVILLIITSVSSAIFDRGVYKIAVLDCGQGFSVIISRDKDCAVIGCTGDGAVNIAASSYIVRNGLKTKLYIKTDINGLRDRTGALFESIYPHKIMGDVREESKLYTDLQTGGVVFSDSESESFLDDCRAEFSADKAALIVTIKNTIMIIPLSVTDLWVPADIIIDPPGSVIKNSAELFPKAVIVSDGRTQAGWAADALTAQGLKTAVTGGFGDIIIKTRGNGDLKIYRE